MSVFDQIAGFQNEATTYPPYNIERLTDNEYRITMAVAGFDKHDIEIEVNEGILSIRGEKKKRKRTSSCTAASHRALSIAASNSPIMSK